MKEIFYELLREAVNGKVIIDGEEWPIGFNSIVVKDGDEISNFNDNNLSTLFIKDIDTFFKLLEDYINLELDIDRKMMKIYDDVFRNKVKLIMAYLFVNATTEDFLNPCNLIRRYISFLDDGTFNDLNDGVEISIDSVMKGSNIFIKNCSQSVLMETPNKMDISIVNGECQYNLPSISYGICNDECYIYSILNPKEKKDMSDEEIRFNKKINRLLYKVNGGVKEAEELDNGLFSYENISDVSPSAVVSLLVFLMLLKEKGITKIKAVPYLPLRYLSRDISANNINDQTKKDKLIERNDMIQTNITNKFINTFKRVGYHMEGVSIEGVPYEFDEFLTVNIGNSISTVFNNEFLKDISISVEEKIM